MAFAEITEFLSDELVLPIRGKQYVVPALNALDGAKFTRLITLFRAVQAGVELSEDELAEVTNADFTDEVFGPTILGSAYGEMIADGVPKMYVDRAFQTAMAFLTDGREAAEAIWSVPDPVGKAPRKPRSKAQAPTT